MSDKKKTTSKKRGADDKEKRRRKGNRNAKFILALVVLGVVVLLGFALWSCYPVAKQQYIATREKQRLELELAAVKARNTELQKEIDRLGTSEGIEDYARHDLGWVKKGESSVIVEGLKDNENASTGVDWRVSASDIELPSTSWTRFLDMIFEIEN